MKWMPAAMLAGAVAGCTAIVGVDKDYELDPKLGKGGSTVTGGGAGLGGSGGNETGGAGGSGGTGGAPGTDGGNDAGGASGTGGRTDASAGAGGSSGATGTGGASGTGGAGATGGTGGTGGSTGGTGGSTGGTGGASGTDGGAGTGGTTGTGGAAGSGTAGTGGTGTAGTGGTGGTAGTGGASGGAGSSGTSGTGGTAVDAGDASGGSAGTAPDAGPDASNDVPPDIGSPCGPGTKFCGVCVATGDPTYGCAGPTCSPCEPNGTATCSGGNCVVTGCNPGYHQVGNVCVANTAEVCNNGIDDDGDTRTDCLDVDCLADPSCTGKCIDAAPIACDTILTGQSTGASGATSRVSTYSCAAGSYPATEYAYRFTGGANQRVYAEIYGLSGNLGLFEVAVSPGAQCTPGTSCGVYSDAVATPGAEALGFTTQAGQDYYLVVDGPDMARNFSLSLQCSTLDGCWPVKPLEPGQSFSATNNPASGAANVTDRKIPIYSCAGFGESGPEAAWMFTPTVTANYRVTVSGLSADCDLYVLSAGDCGGTCLGATTYSDNFGIATELVTFQGVANTSYYIVVDGYLDAVCNFTIGLVQL